MNGDNSPHIIPVYIYLNQAKNTLFFLITTKLHTQIKNKWKKIKLKNSYIIQDDKN